MSKIIISFIGCLLYMAFEAEAQSFSTVGNTGIPALGNSKSEWADFNNDDLPDLIITGIDNSGLKIFEIYRNNGDATFTAAGLPVVALKNESFQLADFNNDNRLDIFYCGRDSENVIKNYLLINNGTGFSIIQDVTYPYYRAEIATIDVNLDGQPDIVIQGYNADGNIEQTLWIQDKLSFTKGNYTLPAHAGGVLKAADFNNDGITDFISSGANQQGQFQTAIYLVDIRAGLSEEIFSPISNILIDRIVTGDFTGDGLLDFIYSGRNAAFDLVLKFHKGLAGSFSEISNPVGTVSSGDLALSDVDNDGDKDLFVIGLDAANEYSANLYYNDGSGAFSNSGMVFKGAANGNVHLADFNKDTRNDLFVTGFSDTDPENAIINYLMQNTGASINTKPTVPQNLMAHVSDSLVHLGWDLSSDVETANNELRYQLALGNSSGSFNIVSEHSLTGGESLLWSNLVNYNNTQAILSRLPEGEYFWKVQAIDAGSLSSGFSVENNFIICDPPNIGDSIEICLSDLLQLQAGTVNDQVNWYSAKEGLLLADNNNFQMTVVGNDTIVVEVIKTLGCTVYDTLIVEAIAIPESNLAANMEKCIGEPFQLEIIEPFAGINWYRKGSSEVLAAAPVLDLELAANDTIIAELIDSKGCVGYDTILLKALEIPEQVLTQTTGICYNDTLNWSLVNSFPITKWFALNEGLIAENVNEINYRFPGSDTLLITKTNSSGCSVTDTVIVNVNALPAIDLGPDVRVCKNDVVSLSVTGIWSSIQWQSLKQGLLAEDVNAIDFLVIENDTITTTVTDGEGCQNADTLVITKSELPVFSLGNDTVICVQESILLSTSSGFAKVEWFSAKYGLLEAEDWFLNYTVLESDTIIAIATGFNNCSFTDSIAIEAIPLPEYDLGVDLSRCLGETVTLELQSFADSVNWYVNYNLLRTHDASVEILLEGSAFVWAEFISPAGCISHDSLFVTINELPIIDLGDDQALCSGEYITLSVPGGFMGNHWYSFRAGQLAENREMIEIQALQNDTIWVEYTDVNGCRASDTVTIQVLDLPAFSLGEDRNICPGTEITLSIDQPADSINWFNEFGEEFLNAEASLMMSPSQSGKCWAEQWTSSGCFASDTILVTINTVPAFDAGPDLLLCENSTVELNPIGVDESWSLAWSPRLEISDASLESPTVTPTASRWYYLTATNSVGCTFTDSVYVDIDGPLVLNAGNDLTICPGSSTRLGAFPVASGSQLDYSYEWFPKKGLDDAFSPNPIAFPDSTTTYQLVVQAGNCKAETAEVTVVVQSALEVLLSADTTIGAGSEVQLQASGARFYRWEPATGLNDATIANPVASPQSTTTYTVTALDGLGCVAVKQVTVFVNNQIFIPNLFTPNNDGQNDYFKLYGAGFKSLIFQVRNREGKLLYNTNSMENAVSFGWDGKYNGNPVPNGIYVWSISGHYFDGTAIQFQGNNSGIINLRR